jgi:hypothetical protein
MKDYSHSYRIFTEAEDELIRRQARGEMTYKSLRQLLHTGGDTLDRRAAELGVALNRSVRLSPMRPPIAPPQDTLTPARINDDKLLERLHDLFPERRYGYMD